MLDDTDKKIIAVMQGEFPLVEEPYQELAQQAGVSEEELLRRLALYQANGQLRKMGTVLRHRAVGYEANALCAWTVESGRLEEVSRIMTREKAVSHCYARANAPDWPYNFYTMIHAQTKEECQKIAEKLARQTNLGVFTMLYSTKEWKKASMKYFSG